MSNLSFNAVIFDLDGVITKTALVHSAAWKSMFDEYLRYRQEKHGGPFREFTIKGDYLPYVDGKPRYDGVKSFLDSRGITLPWGDPSDPPEAETICGIGNRKNIAFNQTLQEKGVEVYETTVQLIRELKTKDIRIGVASSSKNCQQVLQRAGIEDLFETRIDGVVTAELHLKGKPEPDIFTKAADNLGVSYDKAVVVEDATSGVAAGKKGNFGLVLGLAREENEKDLLIHGADIVVKDIGEIGLEGLEAWFKHGYHLDNWCIAYHDYIPGKEATRESLLTVGNGYFGTRGSMEDMPYGGASYPGTYMAGVYNRLMSKVGDRDIENEDFVNVINWLPVGFKIDDSEWIDLNKVKILDIHRVLHFNNGTLYRRLKIRDDQGRETMIDSLRFASMDNPHFAAIEYTITPLNYSGKVTINSGLHGNHVNAGVERYKQLNQKHLQPLVSGNEGDIQYLTVRTTQSNIEIAAAARITVFDEDHEVASEPLARHTDGESNLEYSMNADKDHPVNITKVVAICKSTDEHIENPLQDAIFMVAGCISFNELLRCSEERWEKIWDRIDVKIEGDRLAQKLLRMHLYHLMVTTSPHNATIDFGIPARGLHGEAYRGHIFWDELYILPIYYIQYKDAARSVLMYRYRRLNEARKYAAEHGYKGAMFPWQSGSSGREETQVVHLNPLTGEWGPDHSSLQRHVSLAIAYNTWQYYWITGDKEFMKHFGTELYFEICRFWVSACMKDSKTGRYSISKVMGPDEFHEHYPGSSEGGLKDNAYTNIMVAWMLEKAIELMEDNNIAEETILRLEITEQEKQQWKEIMHNLNLVISPDGIIAQYDGYFDLLELDWNYYKEKYGNIYRMDRLLKAEGKSPDQYKVAKQADTLMTFYNLDKEEADAIIRKLGYSLPEDYISKNLEYYLARTSHGSTLSRVVHAHLANLIGNKELSWELYSNALTSDFQDVQGGTTGEGIHAGVMAGTVWIAISSFGGLDLMSDPIAFNPNLPDHWKKISFGFTFREKEFECEITHDQLRIRVESEDDKMVSLILADKLISVKPNSWVEFSY